jgi:dipeptidyl-peptidase-4
MKRIRWGAVVLALLTTAAPLVLGLAPPARADQDLLEQYAATDRFRNGLPRAFIVTPDGREVLFVRSGPRDRVGDLYSLDTKTGAERVVLTSKQLLAGSSEHLTAEQLARLERQRLAARGIVSFELSADGRRLLVPISGRLFVVERASGAIRELSPGTKEAAEDAHFSPDGERIACVRKGDVHVIELATGDEHAITSHTGEHESWGSPEFVAQEEMDRFEGWWWSPDSRTLLVQHTDESDVEKMHIADPAHPEVAPQEWAYPRAGTKNAEVRLFLVPAAGGTPRPVEWDPTRYPYLCSATWAKEAPPTLVVMDRDQHEEAILAVDTATCATHPLLVERDDKFLNLHAGAPRWLAGGRTWLWIAERDDSGPWLERRSPAAGVPVRLSPPGLRVHSLLGVDEKRGAAYVLASDDPREQHVWRLPLAGGRPVRIGNDAGVEEGTFAHEGSVHVRSTNPIDGVKRFIAEDGDGRRLAALRSVCEAPLITPGIEWTRIGADSMNAAIIRPRNFQAGRHYPVLEYVYGGPHSLQVSHYRNQYVMPQWLADHGFIVVSLDGHGTPWRGRSWERSIRGDLIGPALADHRAGLRELMARYPEMDPQRVGIYGWSFGGYFTVLALERAGDLYRAGVAGAPVVDFRDYDTFYTERYLGLPQRDSLAYTRSSGLTDAAKLARPLLIVHGTADDNVYFFNSLKLADALGHAQVPFDFLPLPGQTHSVNDPGLQREYQMRMVDFFTRELGRPEGAAARP